MYPASPDIDPNPVSTALDERLSALDFGGTRIYFLTGYPRSSLGKGNLIARLARVAGGPVSIIKYDGILNTNVSNNHPSPVDDLATYRRFHDGIKLGWPNQILGGEVLADFIGEFGGTDYEQLTFVPHVAKFLLTRLNHAWRAAGRPDALFVELGGTACDPELTTFVLPAVMLLKNLHDRVYVMLLTEVARDHAGVKTRAALEGLRHGLHHGIIFDTVFVRQPADVRELDLEGDKLADYISGKIARAAVYGGRSPAVVVIPHFDGPGLDGYLEYLAAHKDKLC
jgi:CTP synthase (UTP-ammonia lyase)